MRLKALISGKAVRQAGGPEEVAVTGVRDDSRRVRPGDLFVARRGSAADGARFVDEAIERGAAAVLADRPLAVGDDAAMLVGDAAGLVGELAERFHGQPARKLSLIGVTGTNGKTTVAWMVRHLINATAGGRGSRCGLISTIEVDVGGAKPEAAELTTPGACALSEMLAAMVDHGCDHCVMEVSSHALDQRRVDALAFDAAVFTNLSGDHLDYHRTMDAYAAAKARLFERLEGGAAVVNGDDAMADRMIADVRGRVLRYGFGETAELTATLEAADATGTAMQLRWGEQTAATTLPLIGRHNAANLLAAIGAAGSLGMSDAGRDKGPALEALAEAARSMPATPGRLERVTAADAPFSVVVDYAHTDDALRNVLQALRPLMPGGGRLWVVFGCGGDRDRTKRPRMARVACELADRVVITSDNPRSEEPERIIDAVMAGVADGDRPRVEREADRSAAIERAIEQAGPGDIVLIAGKGHEDYQIIGDERRMFDDRIEAKAALRRRLGDPAVLEETRR